mgnify:FL=1
MGFLYFIRCICQSIRRDHRLQPCRAARKLSARQAGIAQDELILVQSLHRRHALRRQYHAAGRAAVQPRRIAVSKAQNGRCGLTHEPLGERYRAHAQDDIGRGRPRLPALQQRRCLECKGRKRREAAAHAGLEQQHETRIPPDVLRRAGRDEADHERAEHVDKQRHERKTALRRERQARAQIARHRTEKAADPDKQAIQHILYPPKKKMTPAKAEVISH